MYDFTNRTFVTWKPANPFERNVGGGIGQGGFRGSPLFRLLSGSSSSSDESNGRFPRGPRVRTESSLWLAHRFPECCFYKVDAALSVWSLDTLYFLTLILNPSSHGYRAPSTLPPLLTLLRSCGALHSAKRSLLLRHQCRVHLMPLGGSFVSQSYPKRRSFLIYPAKKTKRTVASRNETALHHDLRIPRQVSCGEQ